MLLLTVLPVFADPSVTTVLDTKVTAAIVETIQMTTAGELDAWIAKYCDPNRCTDEARKAEWKAYQLKQANLKAGACLKDGTVSVKQRMGDASTGAETRWFIRCEGREMPVAVRFRYDAAEDRVWFSHLGF